MTERKVFHVCDGCRIATSAYASEEPNGCIRCGQEMREALSWEAAAIGIELCLTCGDRGWVVRGHLEDGTAEQFPCPDCDEYELRQRGLTSSL